MRQIKIYKNYGELEYGGNNPILVQKLSDSLTEDMAKAYLVGTVKGAELKYAKPYGILVDSDNYLVMTYGKKADKYY